MEYLKLVSEGHGVNSYLNPINTNEGSLNPIQEINIKIRPLKQNKCTIEIYEIVETGAVEKPGEKYQKYTSKTHKIEGELINLLGIIQIHEKDLDLIKRCQAGSE